MTSMPFDRSPDHTCLFLDVDGSLIDIAPRPEAVVVPTTLVRDLGKVNAVLGGALALISGRSIAQLDDLFTPLRLRASGVHGAEMRYEPDEPVDSSSENRIPDDVRAEAESLVARFPGTMVEDKAYSLALHYRAAPQSGAALQDAAQALVARHLAAGLQLMSGHSVVEIKRPSFDKGAAVRRFLSQPRFAGRKPIYIGDDVTDQPAFAAAIRAGGSAYGVGAEIAGTTGTFASPSDVRNWVGSIADQETMPA